MTQQPTQQQLEASMNEFGNQVVIYTRLALSPEVALAERQAYRRWVEHNVNILDHIATWVACYPTDGSQLREAAQNVVLPELTVVKERLQRISPLAYHKLGLHVWQDFVLWCRENPESI